MSVTELTVSQSRLHNAYAVRQISELKYEGIAPLSKPSEGSRGVYGGNLCGQSVLVAMETVPEGFTPHSLHSYFVKAGDDSIPCEFHVEKVSDGKNFANRLLRVVQRGETKYLVMISLTKKNSVRDAEQKYLSETQAQRQQQQAPQTGRAPIFPLDFQTAPPRQFQRHHHSDLTTRTDHDHSKLLQHKFVPEFFNSRLTEREELAKSAAAREMSFWVRVDDQLDSSASAEKLKFAGFGAMSDSLYLSGLSRILHLPLKNGSLSSGGKGDHFFSVSLDHSIYFHDVDFDPTKWTFFNFKAPRFANNRVLLQGSYYNEDGKLFASIVQEGYVLFHGGHELKAKL